MNSQEQEAGRPVLSAGNEFRDLVCPLARQPARRIVSVPVVASRCSCTTVADDD